MNAKLLAVIIILSTISAQAWAESSLDTGARLEIFNKASELFEAECLKSDGQIKSEPSWCVDEYKRLAQDLKEITAIIEKEEPPKTEASGDARCANCSSNQPLLPVEIEEIAATLMSEFFVCEPNKKGQLFSKECVSDISCNIFRSVKGPKGSDLVCKNESNMKSNCITELLHGVGNDIVFSLKGLFIELPILIGKAVKYSYETSKELAKDFWSSFWQSEEATTEAMLNATHRSDQDIAAIIADKGKFLGIVVNSLMDQLGQHIRNDYGCERWSGVPHVSKCLQPLFKWDCGSCEQKMNAICGVVGLFSGEIVSSYLTGGALGLLKVLGARSAQELNAASEFVQTRFSGASSVAESANYFMSITGKSLLQVGKMPIKGIRALYNSIVARPFVKGMARGSISTANKGKDFLKTNETLTVIGRGLGKSVQGATKVVRYAVYPASKYLELLDKASRLGYRNATQFFILNKSSMGYATATVNPETLRVGDQIQTPMQTSNGTAVISVNDKKVYLKEKVNGKYVVIKEIK